MYIKSDKIYAYRVNEGDAFELSDYVNRFFTMEKVHSLNQTSVPFVQQYYDKEKPNRRTGNAPDKYKILGGKFQK